MEIQMDRKNLWNNDQEAFPGISINQSEDIRNKTLLLMLNWRKNHPEEKFFPDDFKGGF